MDLKLTEQQKKYLLYFRDFDEMNSISDFSKYFDCSRTNSKKILDRMLKLGLFYKDENKYILTSFGETLANRIHDSRDDIKMLLESVFFLNEEEARTYANLMVGIENDFSQFLRNKSSRYQAALNKGSDISYLDIKKILGEGKFPVSFVIYKNESSDKESMINFSMANKAYEDRAYLEITEESFVSLHSKAIEKKHKGYFKKGVVQELYYKKEDKEYKVLSKDSVVSIPLDVFHTWKNFGNGIFCSNIWIKHKVSIGFVNHSRKSNYLILLNLAEI